MEQLRTEFLGLGKARFTNRSGLEITLQVADVIRFTNKIGYTQTLVVSRIEAKSIYLAPVHMPSAIGRNCFTTVARYLSYADCTINSKAVRSR